MNDFEPHPVEVVACPVCKAKLGESCLAPWSKKTRAPHRARWIKSGLIGPKDRVPKQI